MGVDPIFLHKRHDRMNKADIAHLALLARIKLTQKEEETLGTQITEVLEYVSQITDITAEEKAKEVGELFNVMRDDEPSHEPGEFSDSLLEAAPDRKDNYVRVKRVLQDSE